jgi:hypothetical protein
MIFIIVSLAVSATVIGGTLWLRARAGQDTASTQALYDREQQ